MKMASPLVAPGVKDNGAPMTAARACALTLCSALILSACSASHDADHRVAAGQTMPHPEVSVTTAADSHRPASPASATPDGIIAESYEGEAQNEAAGETESASTGTAVGQKVEQLRGELDKLDSNVRSQASALQGLRASTQTNAADYYTSIAAINAKLQVGTTTGNPILVAQWNQAQAKLDNLAGDVGRLNTLSNQIAASASQSAFILESVRATFGLSGAVDEDHVQLATLEDDVNRTVVLIDRLLNEISGDLNRQNTYVAAERRNLQTLSLAINNGEMYGASLANRPYMTAFAPPGDSGTHGNRESGRPLVVIRFDRQNVNLPACRVPGGQPGARPLSAGQLRRRRRQPQRRQRRRRSARDRGRQAQRRWRGAHLERDGPALEPHHHVGDNQQRRDDDRGPGLRSLTIADWSRRTGWARTVSRSARSSAG